jgi:hypothetical protein
LQGRKIKEKYVLPRGLELLLLRRGTKDVAHTMENQCQTACKGGMEVVRCPWNPVMTVVNVGVIIMPCPPQQLDTHYIKWNVQKNYAQSH